MRLMKSSSGRRVTASLSVLEAGIRSGQQDKVSGAQRSLLCGLHNQIPSSTHSSVVQGHIEFQRLLDGQQ